jgi:hypothetical protein
VTHNPFTDVNWRRQSKGKLPNLPHERKALAERYTIDADEADRRAQRAAEEAAAEEAARLAAAEEAARRSAEEEAARAAPSVAVGHELAEQAQAFASTQSERELVLGPPDVEPLPPDTTEPVVVAGAAEEEGATQTTELPIYRWFGNG